MCISQPFVHQISSKVIHSFSICQFPSNREHISEGMEKLISNRCNVLPESYVLSPETRPGKLAVPLCKTLPIIDLDKGVGCDRSQLIQQIIKACQEFGFFQVVNHGVSGELMQKTLEVAKELFELPAEEKASLYSEEPSRNCRLFSSVDYLNENVHFWRDALRHYCHPIEDYVHSWPAKPTQYREVVGKYASEVRKLSLLILDLIREGLGLEEGYFSNGLTQVQMINVNQYPPCPDPSLTLGLFKHSDASLITLLNQGDVMGLQILKDEQWLGVEPLPNAFVVNVGLALQVISNGRLKDGVHRVVTNASVARRTVASFIHASNESYIEPAKALLNKSNPPLYRAFLYKELLSNYVADTREGKLPVDRYKLQNIILV